MCKNRVTTVNRINNKVFYNRLNVGMCMKLSNTRGKIKNKKQKTLEFQQPS